MPLYLGDLLENEEKEKLYEHSSLIISKISSTHVFYIGITSDPMKRSVLHDKEVMKLKHMHVLCKISNKDDATEIFTRLLEKYGNRKKNKNEIQHNEDESINLDHEEIGDGENWVYAAFATPYSPPRRKRRAKKSILKPRRMKDSKTRRRAKKVVKKIENIEAEII